MLRKATTLTGERRQKPKSKKKSSPPTEQRDRPLTLGEAKLLMVEGGVGRTIKFKTLDKLIKHGYAERDGSAYLKYHKYTCRFLVYNVTEAGRELIRDNPQWFGVSG